MLEFEGINYWAVLVAWLVNVVIGSFWYSPLGFAKKWEKHTGINLMKIPEKRATKIIVSVAMSAALQAITLALVLNSLDVSTASNGLLAGFVLWLGFTAATTVGVTLYSNKSWKFLWLNSSYFLVVMTINSVLLSVWQ